MRILVLFFLLCGPLVFGQYSTSYYLPQNIKYNSSIPKPEDFLGFEVGSQHAMPHEILAYAKKIAEVSDRVEIETYGRTFENKELVLLRISSTNNLKNIDLIKKQRADLQEPQNSSKLDINKIPGVMWMGYSVHGNEASGTNASLMAMYFLAAAEGGFIDSLLNENVILIDPCINPDGGTRFASWVNANKSTNLVSDLNSREFRETWPGGRTNHYWFDLNRDWLYQQLPESKGRLKKYYEWVPNVLTDHHEMGSNSSFFFQPGIPARMHPMTPKRNLELTQKIGTYHAAGLDALGSRYYTEENYDDFYYGKGSTLPDVNGSIGILFEQASSRGHLQQTVNGPLAFPFTVRNQVSTTLSGLKALKNMRVELNTFMRDFYAEKPSEGPKFYVFGNSHDPYTTWEMVNVLKRNKIKVYDLNKDESIGALKFTKGKAYIVPAGQPRHRLIKSLFEKRTTFLDSAFYDISAWTLPLCMNVPYAESIIEINLGSEVLENSKPTGGIVGSASYSYLMEWKHYLAPKMAKDLMVAGFKLKYATEPFSVETANGLRNFSFGTIQIESKPEAKDVLEKLAKENGIEIFSVKTGLSSVGIDLGSEKWRSMENPKALLIIGDGIDANDAGEIWHLMDQRLSLSPTLADLNTVSRLDLNSYSHIIMPSGRYADLISEDKIKGFLGKGGTIVAFGEANAWLSQKKISSLAIKAEASANDKSKRPFNAKNAYDGALETSGAIVDASVDISHPMMYGYNQNSLAVFKVNNVAFEDTGNPYNTPLIIKNPALVAGYIHTKNRERFKNSPEIVCLNASGGKIIHIADNPNFRAFWYGTNKIFFNSLYFSGALGGLRFGDE